jgi:hypothetical protein
MQADVSQADQLAAVLSEIDRTLPPLRGVIHAAGVLDDGVLLQQNGARFERVSAPKVDGAWNLHVLTRTRPLDFFVNFSSVASVLGSSGQGNYAAANAFLDALAHYRQALGLPGQSINWGAWSEVGMAAALGARDQSRRVQRGIGAIDPEQGVRILDQILRRGAAQITVLPIDWAQLIEQFPAGGPPPLLAEIAQETQRDPASGERHNGHVDFMRQFQASAPDQRPALVLSHLSDQVMKVMNLPPTFALDPLQPLNELGIDSLMAVELRNRVEGDLKVKVPVAQLLEGVSVQDVAAMVLQQLGDGAPTPDEQGAAAPTVAQPDSSSGQSIPDQVEQLSDEEVDSMLKTLLSEARS